MLPFITAYDPLVGSSGSIDPVTVPSTAGPAWPLGGARKAR